MLNMHVECIIISSRKKDKSKRMHFVSVPKNSDLPTSIAEDILSVKRQESTASCTIFFCECGE